MTTTRRYFLTILLGASLMADLTANATDLVLQVDPSSGSAEIPLLDVLAQAPPGSLVVEVSASHGSAEIERHLLRYTATAELWTAGTDVIRIVLSPESDLRLPVVAMSYVEVEYVNDFEDVTDIWDLRDEYLSIGGDPHGLVATEDAALAGGLGIRFAPQDYASWLHIDSQGSGHGGGGQHGDCTRGTIDPPLPPDNDPLSAQAPWPVLVAGGDNGPALEVRMQLSSDAFYEIDVLPSDAWLSIDPEWIRLDRRPHVLALSWWRDEETGEGGYQLLIDGQVRRYVAGLANDWQITGWDFGMTKETVPAELHLDTVMLIGGPLRPAYFYEIREDFETDLSAWWVTPHNVTLTPTAALGGQTGLAVDVGSSGAADSYVAFQQDPASWTGLRFTFDPNGLHLNAQESISLLHGRSPSGENVLDLVLVSERGQYYVKTVVTAESSTHWIPITDYSTTFELTWSPSLGARPTGGLRLWIDGEIAAEIETIDNSGETIGELRFGGMSAPGPRGTIFFDDIEVWTKERFASNP